MAKLFRIQWRENKIEIYMRWSSIEVNIRKSATELG
jgi:hypothetical protein